MSSADWIALGGVIVAMVAFAISARAYQLQRRSQITSDEQQLNDLIEKIQDHLASLGTQAAVTLAGYAANNTTMAGLQGLALGARKLTKRAGIEPDWFQSMVLAYAFSQVWDPAGAIEYWQRAVDVARAHQSRIRSLAARADFYYNRGLDDDWVLARRDFKTALDELNEDPDRQGRDLAAEQRASLLVFQASSELMIGDNERAVGLIADSFQESNGLTASWRKKRALALVGAFVLQQLAVPPQELLQPVAAELLRRGVRPDMFPDITAALFSPPAASIFGGTPASPGQPAGSYGTAASPGRPAGSYGTPASPGRPAGSSGEPSI